MLRQNAPLPPTYVILAQWYQIITQQPLHAIFHLVSPEENMVSSKKPRNPTKHWMKSACFHTHEHEKYLNRGVCACVCVRGVRVLNSV